MSRCDGQHVFTYLSQPILWKKFIDDIFPPWPHGLTALQQQFINQLNAVQPTIKCISEISSLQMCLLAIIIYIKEGQLHTRLYTNPTDRCMILNYLSECPTCLKRSIHYSQFLDSRNSFWITTPIGSINTYVFNFLWRDHPHDEIQQAWEQSGKFARETTVSPLNLWHSDTFHVHSHIQHDQT